MQTYTDSIRLKQLRTAVTERIPPQARLGDIWTYLGWDHDASVAYPLAKARGIDLRPLLAPDFADIVSILVDGSFGFPYGGRKFSWIKVLKGQVPVFAGDSPKARLLAVIDCAHKALLN